MTGDHIKLLVLKEGWKAVRVPRIGPAGLRYSRSRRPNELGALPLDWAIPIRSLGVRSKWTNEREDVDWINGRAQGRLSRRWFFGDIELSAASHRGAASPSLVPRSKCAQDEYGENHVADRRLPGFWYEDRHLSFFLAFLVLMTTVVPMVGESRPGRIAIDLTFALMLLSGAIATVNKRMLMSLIIALTILEFTADLIVEFNPSFSPRVGTLPSRCFVWPFSWS